MSWIPPSDVQLGIVGKANVGKSTFFAAATLMDVKRGPYPFVTIEPNKGLAHVRFECVCKEFGVKDNPRNSQCIDGWRFVPVEIVDVAGLVPDAWQGRGLGNKFLDEIRRADVLIIVIDAAGSTDSEGRLVKPGTADPAEDLRLVIREFEMWMFQNVKRSWDKVKKQVEVAMKPLIDAVYDVVSGYAIKRKVVEQVLEELSLARKKPSSWSDADLMAFVRELRKRAKPFVVAANKADIPEAEDNIKRLKQEFPDIPIIPTSAEAELALRKAARAGLVKYLPGDKDFEVVDESRLTPQQKRALEYIRENVFRRWGGTGVQEVINTAVFKVLRMICVFPVEDENRLCDRNGNVLPDVIMLPEGSTARDLAYRIHSELGEKFVAAIDVRTRRRLGADTPLKHRDVVKIIARR